jgi:hypothetical protein
MSIPTLNSHRALPVAQLVACFDFSFHVSLPFLVSFHSRNIPNHPSTFLHPKDEAQMRLSDVGEAKKKTYSEM